MSQETVFNGRYELHRRIARGGMADVFLARDQLLDRPVAVKVLFPEFATDPSFVERFRREAQSAANLNHPNIVSVYDWGQEQGTYFIVMEYIDGRSLADILRTEGPLHPQRAAEVASDIAAALGFAHRNGVVHRDVKPGNVLISPSGQVKVADFGIARARSRSRLQPHTSRLGHGHGHVLRAGAGTGAPARPAQRPVLARRRALRDGHRPAAVQRREPGGDRLQARARATGAAAAPQHERAHGDLEAIILKLLSKNPQARYPSAEDLRADLRRFREGQPVFAVAGAAAGGAAAAGATQAMAATQAVRGVEGTSAVPVSDYPAAYSEPRRSGAFLVVLILLLLILGGLLFALAKVISGGGSSAATADITVPQGGVVGKPEAEATQNLQTAGFDVTPIHEKNDTVAEGIVVSVDPAEGTTVKVDQGKRGTATIHVSSGANTVKMPSVVGQLQDDAINFLRSQGFSAITVQEAPSDDPNVQKGEVTKQDPPEGADVAKTVPDRPHGVVGEAEGRRPRRRRQVGGARPRASSASRARRFEDQTEASDTVPKDQVIRTDPAAGTQVDKGSNVTIVVSSGKAQVSVPSVTGLTKAAADNAITNAGLVPQAHCTDVNLGAGRSDVTSQSPAKDTKVDKGSAVKFDFDAPVCA